MIKINFNQILSSTKKTVINAGFTLIELMVVIAIFTLITTIALFDQGKMNSNVLLTNLAYDIALSVRQAQSYGIGVKYSDPVPSGIDGGYGIYVTKSKPDTLIIFHDVDGSGGYDPTYDGLPEKEYVFSNQRGNSIKFLCAQHTGQVKRLSGDILAIISADREHGGQPHLHPRPIVDSKFGVAAALRCR